MDERKNLTEFCASIRKRTQDHTDTAKLASNIPSTMISILRQELDSLIRVVYLLSISDMAARDKLINQTLTNQSWTIETKNGRVKKITERDMVELSSSLIGWTKSVYKFGCSFIHLSGFHNYDATNPLDKLSGEERSDLLNHMRQYHHGPNSNNPSFKEFCVFLPAVLEKISGNLACYLDHLEKREILDPPEI